MDGVANLKVILTLYFPSLQSTEKPICIEIKTKTGKKCRPGFAVVGMREAGLVTV